MSLWMKFLLCTYSIRLICKETKQNSITDMTDFPEKQLPSNSTKKTQWLIKSFQFNNVTTTTTNKNNINNNNNNNNNSNNNTLYLNRVTGFTLSNFHLGPVEMRLLATTLALAYSYRWVCLLSPKQNVERLDRQLNVPVHGRCGKRRSPKVQSSTRPGIETRTSWLAVSNLTNYINLAHTSCHHCCRKCGAILRFGSLMTQYLGGEGRGSRYWGCRSPLPKLSGPCTANVIVTAIIISLLMLLHVLKMFSHPCLLALNQYLIQSTRKTCSFTVDTFIGL